MKKILLMTSLLLLSACAANKVNEEAPVNAEIYLIHTKMKSYEVIGEENRRDWSEKLTIDDIVKSLPENSEATLIYKTNISANWGKVAEKEEYNFLDEKWNIKNREFISKTEEKNPKTSSFNFKMKPIYFSDGRAVAEMRFGMQFLTSINKYSDKDLYYPEYENFQDSKSIGFLPNKYYVFSTIPLKDKSSLILIYKLKN